MLIDTSGLKGVAKVKVTSSRCSADGDQITCDDDGSLHAPEKPFTLSTDPAAKVGATGTIGYRVTADRATGDTGSTQLVVGSPNLVVGKIPDRGGLKVGSAAELPFAVRNTGNLATERVDLHMTGVPGLAWVDRPRNCRFSSDRDGSGDVYCSFDVALKPGQSAEASDPLTVRMTDQAMAPYVEWSAEAVHHDSPPDTNGTPGTGPAVSLTPSSGGDFEPGAKSTVGFSVDNHADFAARGGTAKQIDYGKAQAEISFGLTNHGPGAAYRQDDKPVLYEDVVLPKGVTAVDNPTEEEPDQDTPGDCRVYLGPTESTPFEPGRGR